MNVIQRWVKNRTLDKIIREKQEGLASEVPEEIVRQRISGSIKKNDFYSLEKLREYFPYVNPEHDSVQKAYAKHYNAKDLQSAHRLFNVFRIEPEHPLSEEIVEISKGSFHAIVIDKEIRKPLILKDKYLVTFRLPKQEITFRRKVSAEEFYQKFQQGSNYQITIPILQRINMLGHSVGEPYISPSNLLFG